jgi:NADH:ubiquinone oxidoreductase subunit K
LAYVLYSLFFWTFGSAFFCCCFATLHRATVPVMDSFTCVSCMQRDQHRHSRVLFLCEVSIVFFFLQTTPSPCFYVCASSLFCVRVCSFAELNRSRLIDLLLIYLVLLLSHHVTIVAFLHWSSLAAQVFHALVRWTKAKENNNTEVEKRAVNNVPPVERPPLLSFSPSFTVVVFSAMLSSPFGRHTLGGGVDCPCCFF